MEDHYPERGSYEGGEMTEKTETTFRWLQRAFLSYVQTERRCDSTGIACDPDKCGCQLEMETWIDDTAH